MKQKPRRHLSIAGMILILCFIIATVFIGDFLVKLVRKPVTNYVIVDGTFAVDTQPAATDGNPQQENGTTAHDASENTAQNDSNAITLTLTATDMGMGSLILVNDAHPYIGTNTLSSLSDVAGDSLKLNNSDLSIQAEAKTPLQQLMGAYTTYNGTCNLQITGTTTGGSLYTTVFSDRSSGYGFDIGLITSSGEVVQYLTKRNEWMVANCHQYGFILRYPDDKTTQTGVSYMPHHFRYVGTVHAAIMHEKQYCLEEYLDFLKTYTAESPLTYTLSETSYSIYYVPADSSGSTVLSIPKETPNYTVSGNNIDGFIITVSSTDSTTT